MYDPAGDKYIVYNEPQSKKRLSPVPPSKFTTRSSAPETGVLDQEDVYTLFKWNGTQYSFPLLEPIPWHRPRRSRWWYFQELAVGPERMQEYIDKIGYGNKDISGGLTTFWLGSSLQISALEQVDLLQQAIFRATAVLSREYRDSAKNITLSEDGGTKLMGKTGSALVTKSGFQGGSSAVINKGRPVLCLRHEHRSRGRRQRRQAREITKSILKEMGIL